MKSLHVTTGTQCTLLNGEECLLVYLFQSGPYSHLADWAINKSILSRGNIASYGVSMSINCRAETALTNCDLFSDHLTSKILSLLMILPDRISMGHKRYVRISLHRAAILWC
jgi:hypothetical protein